MNGIKEGETRSGLYYEGYRILKEKRPMYSIIENVKNLTSKRFKTQFNSILKDLSDLGYKNYWQILNSKDYGVPQNRKRIIIVGLDRKYYGDKCEVMLKQFYEVILPAHKEEKRKTVRDAIGDLPQLLPLVEPIKVNGKKLSHDLPEPEINGHVSRFHSERDIRLFQFLEDDVESGRKQFVDAESLKRLYTLLTGKTSSVHKYYVLRWDEPSNLIPAHLYKDGLRHIHPDPKQGRSITVREAARLQTFPDEYIFHSSQTEAFKMIGNAVPPLFARKVAEALNTLIEQNEE